jgi:subtilase family serine protease
MNAAINGGVDIYTSYDPPASPSATPGAWQSTGGTSCASPETAALIALAGQAASDMLGNGKTVSIGALNPILYSLPATDFNDIVSESLGADGQQVTIDNDSLYYSAALAKLRPKNVPPVAVSGYYTTPGYDLATGLGTPKAESFVIDIAKARVAQETPSSLLP